MCLLWRHNNVSATFSVFGELNFCRLPKKMSGSGSHRGFGFVEFLTKDDAKVTSPIRFIDPIRKGQQNAYSLQRGWWFQNTRVVLKLKTMIYECSTCLRATASFVVYCCGAYMLWIMSMGALVVAGVWDAVSQHAFIRTTPGTGVGVRGRWRRRVTSENG